MDQDVNLKVKKEIFKDLRHFMLRCYEDIFFYS